MKKYLVTPTANEREQRTARVAAGKAVKSMARARILLKVDPADGGPAGRTARSPGWPRSAPIPLPAPGGGSSSTVRGYLHPAARKR